MVKPAPYPADVRAKGWRFEIDYEKVEQSDTWALAPAEARPWLLMLWLTAWRQTPCGSLPQEDALIAARISMPAKAYQKHRDVLRRGWWLAEDGRLYHDTIVSRVLEMLEYRRKNAERVAAHTARKKQSPGTNALAPGEKHSSNVTGTGYGTNREENTTLPELRAGPGGGESATPTKAGEVCRAIKAKGLANVNPSDPTLLAFITQGVPLEVFEAAAQTCANARPPKGMAYLLGIVKRQLGEAASIASGVGMPAKPWDASRSTIEAKAAELGLKGWDESDLSVSRETFEAFTQRVRTCVEAMEIH